MSSTKRSGLEEAPDTLTHLHLNPKNSSWANFGFWKDTDDYPTACRTLALLLGKKADLRPEQEVLDLGFGCGDQFFVWKEEFSLPFSHLTGINPSSVQVEFAENLFQERKEVLPKLICAPLEETISSFPEESFDRILCLDSAYFFPDRVRFCEEAFRVLKPKGRLVSAELILRDGSFGILDSWFRSFVCKLSGIPLRNRVTPNSLFQILERTGFKTEKFEFLEENVFGGFAKFLKEKTKKDQKEIPEKIAAKYGSFGKFLGGERMKRYFQFVLYSAEKPMN
ncbi:class I SAM-dependent methyltransferase [Leptospira sp. 201903070]|jgi:ubiquinone/menaquinone biosynthesis C-methylase UbiE|uniref:Class I SAM-dependent methyltransferase n=1 Tax=Leptospira ainlahdjerensis TaxID=2810033 RepID=A0ABS2U7H6_9LEPT|nr:class I SAM-dependent methyltransferase [Leptospira ainlahdjerensis]MBM9576325.1 class I SAM-dependent methyltransferase [Leptospira ainlahdjerensis]